MHISINKNDKSLLKKGRYRGDKPLKTISSKISIRRTNSTIKLFDANVNSSNKTNVSLKNLRNLFSSSIRLKKNQSEEISRSRKKNLNCANYKRTIIIHFRIWKMLLLWIYCKSKQFVNLVILISKAFILPCLRLLWFLFSVGIEWIKMKIGYQNSRSVLKLMPSLEEFVQFNSHLKSAQYKFLFFILSPIFSILIAVKDSFQLSLYQYRLRHAVMLTVRPSDLLYVQDVIPSYRVEFNGKFIPLLSLLKSAYERSIGVAEIARNIVVVRRKDRRGVYYSKENFNNPHLIPGWCIVKGSGCAWVLKTLEEWKFLDTVQVKHILEIPEKYWIEACGLSVKNGGKDVSVMDINSVTTDFEKEKSVMYRQWKKTLTPTLFCKSSDKLDDTSKLRIDECRASLSRSSYKIEGCSQKPLPQEVDGGMDVFSLIALSFYIALIVLVSMYYYVLKVKQPQKVGF